MLALEIAEHAVFVTVIIRVIWQIYRRGLIPFISDITASFLAGATALPGVAGIVEGEVNKLSLYDYKWRDVGVFLSCIGVFTFR
jgi:hypothetical protein